MVTPATLAVAVALPSDGTDGPFDREDLVQNGVHDPNAPDSVRMLGDPVSGSMAVRHVPASPLESEWDWVEPGETIKTDTIQIYTTAFGDATGDYELVVVQWTDTKRRVQTENGSQRQAVAADQTVQRIGLTVEDGYAKQEVQLASAYNDSQQVTMWLERDGERVNGVRWRFEHQSVASGQTVAISTQADAWWYAARTVLLPGIAGIIGGLSLAQVTLREIGRGPGYGLGVWIFLGAVALAAALGGAYYEVAMIMANFDMLMGLSLGVVAFGGGLRMHAPVEWIGFERQELSDAKSLRRSDEGDAGGPDPLADGGTAQAGGSDVIQIPDDGYRDELYEDLIELPTVRNDDGDRHVPVTGLFPAFARFFADAARLDLSSLKTRVRVAGGRLSEKVYVDPESDKAVNHKPARLKRRMPVWHRLPEPEDGEELDTETKVLYGALTLGTIALPWIGWKAGEAMMQTPTVGAILGLVVLAIESYGAHDGHIDFTPAPRHFKSANASLTILQDEFADAKTLEAFEEIAWNERTQTALEARQVEARRDTSITQRLNEAALGMDVDVMDDESATEDEQQAARELLGGPDEDDATGNGREARADGGDGSEQ